MSEPTTIRYYRGRRVAWNSVNQLWWFKTTDQWGDRVERCRGCFGSACAEIDNDFELKAKKACSKLLKGEL